MSEYRQRILEMLEAGKITAAEATKLLEAFDNTPPRLKSQHPIKYLRVIIDTPKNRYHEDKPENVNIRVPVALIRAGMKFTSLIPKDAADKIEDAMKEKGIKLNLKNIKDEDIEELIEAMAELEIDIDGGEGKVRVTAE